MEIDGLSLVLALLVLGTVLWTWAGGLMGVFQSKTGGRIVLRVRNCEACIEGVVRNLLPQMQAEGWQVTVVDFGSDDDTPIILHRLNRALPGLEVIPPGSMPEEPLVEVDLSHLSDSREGCRLVRKELAAREGRLSWL
ncbi:MAG: hypothetical protein ACOY9Y_15545 [Bacillota bacterium]